MTPAEPYKELFVMEEPDGSHEPPHCFFACNTCGRHLDDGPCPDHAPLTTPGLALVECDATPRHAHMYAFDSEAYDAPCMYCAYNGLQDRVDYLERCRHTWIRRTQLFHRLARLAYSLGIVAGYCISHGGGPYAHDGCAHGFRWRSRRRPYILGWPSWKWSCVLRGRHWPGEFVGLESCTKCLPCPDCGATTGCIYFCDNRAVTR